MWKVISHVNHDETDRIKIYTQNYFQQHFSHVKHLQVKPYFSPV